MQEPTTAERAAADRGTAAGPAGRTRLPWVVHVLALGTFLMLTTEFVVAGILLEVADDLGVSVTRAGHLITVFAAGMIVGSPVMAMATMRLSKRLTLVLALVVFIVGHVVVALGSDFTVLMVARFVTAVATGAFWAVSAVVATTAAGPAAGARAVAVVGAGGALATVLGVPLGAFVAQLLGWRGTFWALAAGAVVVAVVVARLVHDAPAREHAVVPTVRGELAGLSSGRLWLTLLAGVTTTGGVLAAYSFIAPILTDQAGVPIALVPLVLTAFGVGSLIGTLLGGRFGDAHPGAVTITAPAVSAVVLVAISLTVGAPWVMTVLVAVLGLFSLSANSVHIHRAVRYAGGTGVLGSALQVSAFNAGTAAGTAIAGGVLAGPGGTQGVAMLGAVIVALTLVPTTVLAVLRRRDEVAPTPVARPVA